MSIKQVVVILVLSSPLFVTAITAHADENLFGYVKGAKTFPAGFYELDQQFTYGGGQRGGYLSRMG